MRRSTAHLYAIGLFLASLIAPFLATPDVLRDHVLLGLLVATPLVAVASLIPGSTDGRTSSGHVDLWVTGIAGLALTGVYWWRASLEISAFGEGLAFEIARTFLFWLPAVLFACLYRSPGEGWLPSGRGRLLLRMTTAFFGAALGVTLQVAVLDAYRERVEADRTSVTASTSAKEPHRAPSAFEGGHRMIDIELDALPRFAGGD